MPKLALEQCDNLKVLAHGGSIKCALKSHVDKLQMNTAAINFKCSLVTIDEDVSHHPSLQSFASKPGED